MAIWPQIIIIIILVTIICNGCITVVDGLIMAGVLYAGGFWDVLLK